MSNRVLAPSALLGPVACLVLLLGFAAACSDRSPVLPEEPGARTGILAPDGPSLNQGKGRGGGSNGKNREGGGGNGDEGEEQEIHVLSIEPDTVAQGNIEEVVVLGEGFDTGSELAWELEGEPTGEVITLSARVVNSQRIEATIAVSLEAPEARYDVVVRTANGRRGVGIEMLEVVEGNIPLAYTFLESTSDGTPAAVTGDGRMDGWYRDGECGVSGIINVRGSGPDGSGDALLRAAWRPVHPRERAECEGRDARGYHVNLGESLDGGEPRPASWATHATLRNVEWVTHEPILSHAGFKLDRCNLRYGPNFPGTDPILITPEREGSRLLGWVVESTGNHVAMCNVLGSDPVEGDLYRVPFRVVIRVLAGEAFFPF